MSSEAPRGTDEDEAPFPEEQRSALSDEDRDFLLALLAAPPRPNAALEKAAREHRRRDD